MPPPANIGSDAFASLNTLDLIRAVEKHEVLYKRNKIFKGTKQSVWDQICREMFPNFDRLDENAQKIVGQSIRGRWKTLRSYLVKSLKNNGANETKLMTETVNAMKFLIPHLRAKPRNKNENSDNNDTASSHGNDDVNADEEDDDVHFDNGNFTFGDLLCVDMSEQPNEAPLEFGTPDKTPQPDYIPEVGLNTKKEAELDIEEDCISIHSGSDVVAQSESDCEVTNSTSVNPVHQPLTKRKRCCVDDDIDTEGSLLGLFSQTVTPYDEGGMFFLSILSDFNRLTPQKKVRVKAKILQAIAEAFD